MNRDSSFYAMLSREMLRVGMQALNEAARLNISDIDVFEIAKYESIGHESTRMQQARILTKAKIKIIEALNQIDCMLEFEQNGKNN